MTDLERARIKAKLVEYTSLNPLNPAHISPDHIAPTEIPSPYISWVMHLGRHLPTRVYVPALLVMALLLMSGTAYGAQGALPGDILYPVKRSINEPIEIAITVSPISRAEVALEHADRRLQEAEILTVRGELDEATALDLGLDFEKKSSKVEELIKEIEDKGDDESAASLASHFEAKLNSHGRILAKVQGNGRGGDVSMATSMMKTMAVEVVDDMDPIEKIKEKVDKKKEEISKKRESNESRVTNGEEERVKTAALKSQEKSERTVSNTEEATVESPEDIDEDVVERISNARENIKKGKEKLDEKSYGDAYIYFENANRDATEAEYISKSNKNINKENKGKKDRENDND